MIVSSLSLQVCKHRQAITCANTAGNTHSLGTMVALKLFFFEQHPFFKCKTLVQKTDGVQKHLRSPRAGGLQGNLHTGPPLTTAQHTQRPKPRSTLKPKGPMI